MAKAGKYLGEYLAKLSERDYSSKTAKIISKVCEVIGWILFGIGFIRTLIVYYLSDESCLREFLICGVGIVVLLGGYGIAFLIEKVHERNKH